MPSIKKNNEQEAALLAISSGLDEVRVLNDMIAAAADGAYTVSVNDSKKLKFVLDKNCNSKLSAILDSMKKARVKEIEAKARKYAIALDDEELAACGISEIQ